MRRALPLLVLVLAGCVSAPPPAPPADAAPAADGEPIEFRNLTGTLLALPVAGGAQAFQVDVPSGSTWVAAALKWQTRGTRLDLAATDPDGRAQGHVRTLAGTGPRAPARLDWWAEQPKAGAWKLEVSGQAALQEPLFLQVHTLRARPHGMHVAEALEVRGFAEVNMVMKQGAVVRWDWGAAEPLAFNVHTHRDGETQVLLENTGPNGRGNFTADQDGTFSLLWEPPGGGSPVPSSTEPALTYRVEGAFELHSAVG